jgi:uncharacterized protein YecE (DUF72 family)
MRVGNRRGLDVVKRVWIGTSGWTYDGWRGPFYPKHVAKKDWLAWYGKQFPSTEINGSFYRTPSLEAVRAWREQTPKDFLFAWKASKFITHWKRLTNSENSIELMVTRLEVLGPKAGPVLFQLPPHFKANRERLVSFLKLLPKRYQYVFEFRDRGWYADAILDVLRDHDISLCLSDHHDAPTPWEVTARHVYVRGHGPGGHYRDNYPDKTLRQWADKIETWKRQRRTVYCYFDNDQKSAAPADAKRLMQLLGERNPKAAKPVRRHAVGFR